MHQDVNTCADKNQQIKAYLEIKYVCKYEQILIQIFQGVQTCQLSVSITLQTTCNTHLLHTHYHIGILRVKPT